MKRNVWFGLIVGCAGCVVLLMLVSAAGAQAAHSGSPTTSRAAFETLTSTQSIGLQPQGGIVAQGSTYGPEAITVEPAGSAFTYQGQLKSDGSPVNGNCDLAFSLWAKRISPSIKYLQVGSTLTETNVVVANGLFNVSLDFGTGDGIFSGDARYLDISVGCPAGSGSYTDLGRQPLTAAPYALGLVPGAAIRGTAYQTLKVMSNAPTGGIPAAVTAEVYNALDGIGLFGVNYTSSPTGTGVFGQQGPGVPAATEYGGVVGSSTLDGGIGVVGESDSNTGTGVYGISSDYGVYGDTTAGTGVYGNSGFGYGVHGISTNGTGVYGTSDAGVGVYGTGTTTGTVGIATAITANIGTGVYGAGGNAGVWGASGHIGVYGNGSYGVSGNGSSDGVIGYSTSAGGIGVEGVSGSGYGVYGQSGSGGYAGYFVGNVSINGNLSKSGGSFKIDDPLDPANKYLYHSFVESPDMLNIYNGNITTDANGDATVVLPDYFEALNHDFRYQLTVIGQFAQAIVQDEITGNRFTIKTDKPNVKVSWQVTGIRQDAWANAHRIPVEEDKPAQERGLYIHPELYGQPASSGVDYTQTHMLEPNAQSTAPTGQP